MSRFIQHPLLQPSLASDILGAHCSFIHGLDTGVATHHREFFHMARLPHGMRTPGLGPRALQALSPQVAIVSSIEDKYRQKQSLTPITVQHPPTPVHGALRLPSVQQEVHTSPYSHTRSNWCCRARH